MLRQINKPTKHRQRYDALVVVIHVHHHLCKVPTTSIIEDTEELVRFVCPIKLHRSSCAHATLSSSCFDSSSILQYSMDKELMDLSLPNVSLVSGGRERGHRGDVSAVPGRRYDLGGDAVVVIGIIGTRALDRRGIPVASTLVGSSDCDAGLQIVCIQRLQYCQLCLIFKLGMILLIQNVRFCHGGISCGGGPLCR